LQKDLQRTFCCSDWFGDVTRCGSVPVLLHTAQTVESSPVTAQIGTSPGHSILVTINFSHRILDGWARQDLGSVRRGEKSLNQYYLPYWLVGKSRELQDPSPIPHKSTVLPRETSSSFFDS